MPPIILVLLQGLFLLLLYLFLARAVRAVVRDVRASAAPRRAPAARPGSRPGAARQPAKRQPAAAPRGGSRRQPAELVVHSPGGKPKVIPLNSGEIRFGRSPQCTVPIEDSYVSEQHARIYQTDDGWVVADMGSTNGTFLNREKVTAPAPLQPGDQVAIGKTVVEVRK